MGVDYFIAMVADTLGTFDPSVYFFADSLLNIVGIFPPAFDGNSVTMGVPLSAFGMDDGDMNVSIAVGTVPEVTDFAPEVDFWTLAFAGTFSPGLASPKAVEVRRANRMIPATGKLPADIRSRIVRRLRR